LVRGSLTGIVGDELVTAVEYEHDGGISRLDASGLFVATARRPRVNSVETVLDLVDDHIAVSADLSTSAAGVFAAGDVRSGTSRTVAGALEDGAVAARAVLARFAASR